MPPIVQAVTVTGETQVIPRQIVFPSVFAAHSVPPYMQDDTVTGFIQAVPLQAVFPSVFAVH